MSKNHSHLSGRQGLDNNLFEAYAKAAEAQGSPSLEDLENSGTNSLWENHPSLVPLVLRLPPTRKQRQKSVCL